MSHENIFTHISIWLYSLTIFLSAFLLFAIQPIIGKYLLPWFGGSASVWSTSLLFFMTLLLGGYIYAHLLTTKMKPKMQILIHLPLLFFGLSAIIFFYFFWPSPITPSAFWKPDEPLLPVYNLLLILMIAVGSPYFILSSTNSIVQSWVSKIHNTPYKLYALSNIGSLLAIFLYPLVIEPNLSIVNQAYFWSIGFILFVILMSFSGLFFLKTLKNKIKQPVSRQNNGKELPDAPTNQQYLTWLFLSAFPSMLLIVTTTQLTQSIAAIPFFWLLPLSLYLLSFIFCFSSYNFYLKRTYAIILIFLLPISIFMWLNSHQISISLHLFFYMATFFLTAMMFHGELYARRPHPQCLTTYYLFITTGGASGAFLINILAPLIFKGYWEFPICLLISLIIPLVIAGFIVEKWFSKSLIRSVQGAVLLYLTFFVVASVVSGKINSVRQIRNFYGVIAITKQKTKSKDVYLLKLINGSILHGQQFSAGPSQYLPTTYYVEDSGIGLAINNHPKRLSRHPLKIGVIGLGIGTLAAYCQPQDYFKFYEINPAVIEIADKYFSYLKHCQGKIDIVKGDGRLSMEKEVKENKNTKFDIIAVDAFTDDSIPIHLLTKEAIQLYLEQLGNDGILAVHISNRYIDLKPVLKSAAKEFQLTGIVINAKVIKYPDRSKQSLWVLLTKNKEVIKTKTISENGTDLSKAKDINLWTDQYSNIFQLIKW